MSSYQMPATQHDIAQLLRLNAALADPSLLESSNLSSSMKPMQAIAITPQHHSSAVAAAASKQRSHTLPVQAHTPNMYRSRLHSMQKQQQQQQMQKQQKQQQQQQQHHRSAMSLDAPDNQFDLWSTPQRRFDDAMSSMNSTCPDLSSMLSSDAFENFVDPLSSSDQASAGADKQRLSQLSFPESDELLDSLISDVVDFSNPLSNTMPSMSSDQSSKRSSTFPGADSPNQWEDLALRIDVDGWLGTAASTPAATPSATPKRRHRATMHVETAEFLSHGKSPKMRRLSTMSGSRSATMAKTVPQQTATQAIPVHTNASQAASGRGVTAARVLSASEAKASMAAMKAGVPVSKKKAKKAGGQRRKQKRR